MNSTITIGRRTFSVTRTNDEPNGSPAYLIRGSRGAEYVTLRNINCGKMVVFNVKRFTYSVGPFADLVLTDESGSLEVVS